MTPTQLQQWLGAHGHPVDVDGQPGPQTRAAIIACFTNTCAPGVTDADLNAIAARLGCSLKQLRAVSIVESGGAGFDQMGRPKILYERHLFYRFTNGQFGITPWSNPKGGGYNEPSWEKLTQAACRDVDAAFAAVSWGKFQVLGSHANGAYPKFLNLGYPSPIELAYSTVTGEAAHYELLARYIDKAGLRGALAKISTNPDDCRAFAKGYNGGSYEQFDYHNKIARAMR